MTKHTPIDVNITPAVDVRGEVFLFYSAANPVTAAYLNKYGDLDFCEQHGRKALEGIARITFRLLSTRLRIGADKHAVTLRFDADHPDENIDIQSAPPKGKDCDTPLDHPRKNRLPHKPESFKDFASTSRQLSFSDENKDHKEYKYTLYVLTGIPDKSRLRFDPRIKNQ